MLAPRLTFMVRIVQKKKKVSDKTDTLFESCVHLVLDNTAGVFGFHEHSFRQAAAHTYRVWHECERTVLFAKLLPFLLPW